MTSMGHESLVELLTVQKDCCEIVKKRATLCVRYAALLLSRLESDGSATEFSASLNTSIETLDFSVESKISVRIWINQAVTGTAMGSKIN